MSDDRTEIARTDERAGFVTYSRVEPREEKAARQGPILTGIEVPADVRPEDERAPDVRADQRVVPGRGVGGKAFAIFAVVALVAFAGGVGVLAGSFLFPTVGKVVPVPGGGKVAAVVADPDVKAVAEPVTAPAKMDVDRFAAVHEPAGQAAASAAPAEVADPVEAATETAQSAKVEAAPVPRSRPEPDVIAAPTVDSSSATDDPSGAPMDGSGTEIAALPAPAELPPRQLGTDLPMPPPAAPQPGPEFRADESNDPLAPSAVVVPDEPASGDALSPPEAIPESRFGTDGDLAGAGPAPEEAMPVEEGNDPYQSALDRWVVLDVRDGRAVIDGRERGVFMVEEGSEIPGVGIVEDIKRRNGRWSVVTTGGSIFSLERVDRRRFWLSRLFR